MYSNGNSFGNSITCLGEAGGSVTSAVCSLRWPPPTWKFGLRQSDDRENI